MRRRAVGRSGVRCNMLGVVAACLGQLHSRLATSMEDCLYALICSVLFCRDEVWRAWFGDPGTNAKESGGRVRCNEGVKGPRM